MDWRVFEMLNFDMILRMDFLRGNRVEINYQHKKVWFNLRNGDQFKFDKGSVKSLLVSAMKTIKMLGKGCISFLAYVISEAKST